MSAPLPFEICKSLIINRDGITWCVGDGVETYFVVTVSFAIFASGLCVVYFTYFSRLPSLCESVAEMRCSCFCY